MNERKVRADAKLKLLPPAAQEKLCDFCLSAGNTLQAARDFVRREWDLSVSINTLSEWLAWYQMKRVAVLREAKVQAWLECEKLEHPELSDEDMFRRGQRKFSLLAIAEENPDEWTKVQALTLDRDRFELRKRQIAQAEATEGLVKDNTLTPEERARRIAEIYGRA